MSKDIIKKASRLELTVEVVSAYVSNNSLPTTELPSMIASIDAALSGLEKSAVDATPPLQPAVNPKRSVFPNYIISLEDGRKFKSMKRHLSLLGMTPDEYRTKWNLPRDYPMVAPSYSAARSALAKKMGLGSKPKKQPKPAPVKRGRKPKAVA